MAPHFPDGQLFVNLRGYDERDPMQPIDALASLLRSMDVPPESVPHDLDEASAMFRRLLTDRRMLFLLDNAGSWELVRPLLPADAGTLVLVTSRDRLVTAPEGFQPITLAQLSTVDALELVSHIVGAPRVAAEPDSAALLARVCGHLPLALRIAAANLADQAGRSITDFVAGGSGHR